MLTIDQINELTFSTSLVKCQGCTNSCRLTINKFSDGRHFTSGNRCERGLGKAKSDNGVPNLFAYKLQRLFSYEPLSDAEAARGRVGIPRVLNMYENYPFWYTLRSCIIRWYYLLYLTERYMKWVSNPFQVNLSVTLRN